MHTRRVKLQGISFAPKGYLIILEYLDELSYCILEMFLDGQCWFSASEGPRSGMELEHQSRVNSETTSICDACLAPFIMQYN